MQSRLVLLIGCLLLGLGLTACGAKQERPQLQVEGVEYQQRPGGTRILTGTLFNPSEQRVPSAQIQVTLLDVDNQAIGSMIVPVQDIGPGERKPFREPVDRKLDVRGVRVKSVLVL